jgi:hypothetical protein
MRGALADPVAEDRVDRRLHDARMVREAEIVVAAEGEILAPAHADARPLRAFADQTMPHEVRAAQCGETVGNAL